MEYHIVLGKPVPRDVPHVPRDDIAHRRRVQGIQGDYLRGETHNKKHIESPMGIQ